VQAKSPDPSPVRPAFKRRGHIVLALLGVLVCVGFVPVATVSWKLIQTSREVLTTAQQQTQLLLAASVAHELDVRVEGLRLQIEGVARTLAAAVRRRGSIPREEIREVLIELTGRHIAYVRYTHFEGNDVRSVSAGDHPDYLEPLFQASLQQAAEAVAAGEGLDASGTAFLSEPILLRSTPRAATLAIAAPVVSGGSFRGVLTALVDLDGVWSAIGRRAEAAHTIFAVDRSGKVFASNDAQQVATGDDRSGSLLVRSFFTAKASQTMPFLNDSPSGSERYIGSFERTRQGWGIIVQAPDRGVYWVVRNMERTAYLWTLAVLVVAGLAAIYFARGLSNPVNRLAEAARRLAAGDFSARVEVRSRNEIGELGYAFNLMGDEIESYVRRLHEAFEQRNELFLGTIRALAEAIDAKDPYTRGHSVRVNRYSMVLGRELGLHGEPSRELDVASLLHDVGKIGIEDAILQKTGALTAEEFAIIKTHTTKGAAIMAPIPQMKNMIPGIRHHHERWDGSGYPDGLAGEGIPQMARIIAVADTFDAITTARPYQQPMTFDQAVRRINELRGPALDARVVDAFNRACQKGAIRPGSGGETAPSAVDGPRLEARAELAQSCG
jgi:HD-GYP domain-containing protein (c-di-GMP phosphodiesterase class II)